MNGELEKVKAILEASPNGVNLRGPKNVRYFLDLLNTVELIFSKRHFVPQRV